MTDDALRQELNRLQRINAALIERVEAGSSLAASPYAAFEHTISLADQVRERTRALRELNETLRLEVSERRATEAKLLQAKQVAEQANHSKTRFLAAISHDLLQPLNAAKLFAATLEQQLQSSVSEPVLHSLQRSLDNIDDLLSTLVDISRLEAGVIQPQPSVFNVQEVLENLYAEHVPLAEQAALTLRLHAYPCVVFTDRTLLFRVLRNFLSNAIRYTPRGGRIVLGMRKQGTQVQLQVWDNGQGIEAADQVRIFEEFQRLASNIDQAKGLGLGLAIVDRIAQLLGHPLLLQSRAGAGSMFGIAVPISLETPLAQGLRQPRLNAPDYLHGAQVVVLEDHAQVREAMAELLNQWHCRVVTAVSADEARQTLTMPPQVLLVDYHLGAQRRGTQEADQLIEQIQQRWPQAERPSVIMITADHSRLLKQELHAAGYWLLHKPIQPMRLRSAITHVLQRIRGN